MAFEITDQNFEKEVIERGGVALMDFWAAWCGPCKMIGPFVENLAVEYEGKALIGKVDVDKNSEVAMNYKVRNIPTIVILKDGVEVERNIGYTTQAKLAELLDKHVEVEAAK